MNRTQQRISKVLGRLTSLAIEDEAEAGMIAEALDVMLDDLHGNDFFGTEGQSDPRGDFRDGEWSMGCVQGIDECSNDDEEE
ncbi:hypothetical protein [Alloalcanivorax xenomutans]|uniref:hypothetical protein n=1 Tax=Alloalcanivorax xenomutans TaxID=1094342 RepID=UPI003BA842AA